MPVAPPAWLTSLKNRMQFMVSGSWGGRGGTTSVLFE